MRVIDHLSLRWTTSYCLSVVQSDLLKCQNKQLTNNEQVLLTLCFVGETLKVFHIMLSYFNSLTSSQANLKQAITVLSSISLWARISLAIDLRFAKEFKSNTIPIDIHHLMIFNNRVILNYTVSKFLARAREFF